MLDKKNKSDLIKGHETIWLGPNKTPSCDLCGDTAHYDCKIPHSSWALLCTDHFNRLGCSTGLGRGQRLYANSQQ